MRGLATTAANSLALKMLTARCAETLETPQHTRPIPENWTHGGRKTSFSEESLNDKWNSNVPHSIHAVIFWSVWTPALSTISSDTWQLALWRQAFYTTTQCRCSSLYCHHYTPSHRFIFLPSHPILSSEGAEDIWILNSSLPSAVVATLCAVL